MIVSPSYSSYLVRMTFVSVGSSSFLVRIDSYTFGPTLNRTLKTARFIRIDSETFGLGSFCDRIVRMGIGSRSDGDRFSRITFVSCSFTYDPTLNRTLKTVRFIRIKSETFGLRSFCNRIVRMGIVSGSDRVRFNPHSHPPPKIWAKIRNHSEQNGKNGKNQSSETVAATVVSV